jgi:small-conductance mechanosensitive channel
VEFTIDALAQILPWALGLALGFPLAMVALGELNAHAEQAGWPVASTIRGIRRLAAPALALMLFLRYVLQRPADDTFTQLATSVFWILVLYLVLAFINQVIFGAARPGSWQSRVPTLLRDLVRFLLVGIGAALIYSEVWGKEIGAAWTALGLGSVVVGLALQEPLGNIVSGLILLAERPLAPGDWIIVEGTTGKVVEINYRSVHVETTTRETKIVPNSALYRGSFSNLSRPTTARTDTVDFSFANDIPPNRVKAVLLDVLKSIPGILDEPTPTVEVVKFSGLAVVYQAELTVARQEDLAHLKNVFLTRAWYAARRNGFRITDGRELVLPPAAAEPAKPAPSPAELLAAFPQFRLGEGSREAVASGVQFRCYGAGEPVVREGGPQDGLYLVLRGEALLTVRDRAGREHRIGRVGPGEFFGETAMVAGQPGDTTVTAAVDLDLLVVDPDALQKLLDQSPRLAQDIGHVLDTRRKAVQSVRGYRTSL